MLLSPQDALVIPLLVAKVASAGIAKALVIGKRLSRKERRGNPNVKTIVINLLGGPGSGKSTTSADLYKDFETLDQAMREFEKITERTVNDNGCGCCGPPHLFSWERS